MKLYFVGYLDLRTSESLAIEDFVLTLMQENLGFKCFFKKTGFHANRIYSHVYLYLLYPSSCIRNILFLLLFALSFAQFPMKQFRYLVRKSFMLLSRKALSNIYFQYLFSNVSSEQFCL